VAGGSLYSVLHVQKRTLPLLSRMIVVTSLAHGMNYLHTMPRPVIHRDLNSHNVLLSDAGQVRCGLQTTGERKKKYRKKEGKLKALEIISPFIVLLIYIFSLGGDYRLW
jgi:serine/threonine protein kinase